MHALQLLYTVTIYWAGNLYIGLLLDWDYVKCKVKISMPKYIKNALHMFQHPPPAQLQDAPHR